MLIFATKNIGKLKEVRAVLQGFEILSQEEAGIDFEVAEDGATYEENALKKAVSIAKLSDKLTLADDSGLEIDFLDKCPGVHTSRFLGSKTPYPEKMRRVLEMMREAPDAERAARFVCVIAVAFPDGVTHVVRGVLEGKIAKEIRAGKTGFGYDPIFYVPEYNMTTAEMSSELKNEISHRGQALRLTREYLRGVFY
jgi:XTP/dITP diphosphohydrolase